MIRLIYPVFLSNIFLASQAFSQVHDVVVFGDSLSTGAAAHPTLKYDADNILKVVLGDLDVEVDKGLLSEYLQESEPGTLVEPKILAPTLREYLNGIDWVFNNFLDILSNRYLNTAEYTWAYLLAHRLGWNKNIYFAAKNGTRLKHLPRQIDRYLDGVGTTLPSKVFIFFTGNDLCARTVETVTSDAEFKANLQVGLDYLMRNSQAAPGGTDVYVISFLSILQLVTSDSILSKSLLAHGQQTTCRGLRENNYQPMPGALPSDEPRNRTFLSRFLPPNPAVICPTLFGHPDVVQKHVSVLANRVRSFRQVSKEVIEALNTQEKQRDEGQNMKFFYLEDSAQMSFTGEDVADDCFHLNVHGQQRLADVLFQNISAIPGGI